MQTLQLLFILPFVQYIASSPLPNKPIGHACSHSHYRNHPRSADSSPQFDDPPIFGPGLGDFCDPPTTITVTVPGPAVTEGAQLEPVTLTVTVTAKGVDTGLLDGIFGPINISQSVKPKKAITVTTRTSTVAPPESTETATVRVTGSEVTVTGETNEVTVTVSAKNAEGVPSTITSHPTSTVAVGDVANARESMPTLSRNREEEAAKSGGGNFADSYSIYPFTQKLRPLWRHESTSPKTNCRTPSSPEHQPRRDADTITPLTPTNNVLECLYFNRKTCFCSNLHCRDTHGARLSYHNFYSG
ncbi:unnamed protein product [Tuber melanosporum]|uniref:(Perigord truffle) hypothetical protein n=1 Tax=Tuber melanosporum (strain Mel28) TaxID=656061 RepID=D5G872_TUBMM|nr:uncharacterized protein GSTUM_00002914001 [Tuber melanosporum]CAZ80715.1 unnamed protein product [Tuber melanosporum]